MRSIPFSILKSSLFLLLILIGNLAAAQTMGSPPPVKEMSELKVMPNSMDKIMHVTRYARSPSTIYTPELKTLLDECYQYALDQKKEDMVSNILATKAIVELTNGSSELAETYIKQAESYLPKLSERQIIGLYSDFTRIYTRLGDLEKTDLYYDKTEALTKDKPQFLMPRIINLRNRTNLAVRNRDLAKVKANYAIALKLSMESGNPTLLKDTRFAYANALLSLHKDDEAFEILKELIPDLDNLINDRTGMFFDILSRNYQSTGDYKNAFTYAEKLFNLPIATIQQKGNSVNRMLILGYLLKDYDNFDAYFAAHQKYGFDQHSLYSLKQYHLAESRYYDVKQKNKLAITSYKKALKLSSAKEVSPIFDLEILTGLVDTYLRMGKTDSAAIYLKKAETLIKKYPLSPVIKLIYNNTLKNFSQYQPVGKDSLLQNLVREMQLKDTLNQMNIDKVTKELETKYRVDEKEKELKLSQQAQQLQTLALKQEKQRGWIIIISTFVAILLFSGFIYILWQRKKQAALLHDATLHTLKKQHELAIMNTLSEAQEVEKKRIAERLHDDVGAMLSIAKLNINTLQENVYVSSNDFNTKLEVTKDLMNNISDSIRNISHALMPIAIEKYGFKAAVYDLIAKIKSAETLSVEYVIEGFDDTEHWPRSFVLSSYRIIQEIVNNAIKHAAATHLFIQLIELDEEITIYIEDNGKGIEKENNKEGAGLKLLQTNIAHLSGKLEMDGKPNEGTFILVEIPIPNAITT